MLGLDSCRDSVAIHARTGCLPGDVQLWPRMSAPQIAGHLARLRGLDHDQRITDLAKRLDVDLDRPVGELSKGNRQKHQDDRPADVVEWLAAQDFRLQVVVAAQIHMAGGAWTSISRQFVIGRRSRLNSMTNAPTARASGARIFLVLAS